MNFKKKILLLWVIFALLDPDPLTRLNPDPQPWFQARVDRRMKGEAIPSEELEEQEQRTALGRLQGWNSWTSI
jgi:hypothetical protein